MLVSRSCSWCHELNPASERWCANCGHAAHKCRLECDCPECETQRRRYALFAIQSKEEGEGLKTANQADELSGF